jgi:hypothetical protein
MIALRFAEGSGAFYGPGLLVGLAVLVVVGPILGAIWLYRVVRRLRLVHSILAFVLFAIGPIWAAAAGSLIGAPLNAQG